MKKSIRTGLAICSLGALVAAACVRADTLSDLAGQLLQQPGASTAVSSALSDSDIAAGLKEALAKGTRSAVNQLGRSNGFWNDTRVRIPLPRAIENVQSLLQGAGLGPQLDQLHQSMNHAAEQAVPVAADVFAAAVQKLTLEDVRNILGGPQDAATQYFKRTTVDTLTEKFKPIVARTTAKVGVVQQYNNALASAGPMAAMLGDKADINDYVTRKALDGLFLYVADEEKSIRTNPAARTSDLLKKVFGGG